MCAHCAESGRRTWIQAILRHRERRRFLFVVISIVVISVAGRDSTLEFVFWYCSALHDFLSNEAGICLHPSSLLDVFARDNSGIENEARGARKPDCATERGINSSSARWAGSGTSCAICSSTVRASPACRALYFHDIFISDPQPNSRYLASPGPQTYSTKLWSATSHL